MPRHMNKDGTWKLPHGLSIIYEDRDILAVDKPAGLLTVGTEKDKSHTAYYVLTDYVRKGAPKSRNRVFIVHRLDRDTSGILVFAKNEDAKFRLQSQWEETSKKYLAVVHGRMEKDTDTISTYLAENAALVVYSTNDPSKGKLSHTTYRVLKRTEKLSLLEVGLLTGRKNQIRVHLAGIGHPIASDKKYGKKEGDEPCKRLALHALSITFTHPFSGKPMTLTAKAPGAFSHMVGEIDLDENRSEPAEGSDATDV